MTTSEKHQKALLGGFERFVGYTHPELVQAVPKILMAFYQADILEEDVLKHWGTHVGKKYVDKDTSKKVRKASEPFLKVCLCCHLWIIYINLLHSGLTKLTTKTVRIRIDE